MDVEGAELHVLKEFNWTALKVHVLIYEHCNMKGPGHGKRFRSIIIASRIPPPTSDHRTK